LRFINEINGDIEHFTTRKAEAFPELANESQFWAVYDCVKQYSMAHVTAFYNTYRSLHYISENRIHGELVECGCFLGGMTAFMAILRNELGLLKQVYAFDSFAGFPDGSVDAFLGKTVGGPQYDNFKSSVMLNLRDSVGSLQGIHLIEGFVENTIPGFGIGNIALLRLDTDHYDSTKVELEHFYPKLVSGGIVIIDDYGLYQGSRQATDEYIARLDAKPMLNRIDNSVWSGVKP
jgi:O-methyltransferase